MNKKNIIIIIVSITFFIGALALFLYANSQNSKTISKKNEGEIKNNIIKTNSSNATYFYDIEGKKLNFDDFSGKPYVVFLWKSDDSKSYQIISLMEKYYEEYKDDINFLAINVNEPDIDLELIDNVKAANFSIPIYFDTDLTLYNEFYYEKLPDIFFLDSERKIEKETLEEIDEDAFTANLDLLINNY